MNNDPTRRRAVGPHLALYSYQLDDSSALSQWAAQRRLVFGDIPLPKTRECPSGTGPPEIRLSTPAEASDWFRQVPGAVVFAWTLHDRSGTPLAVSASLFPTVMMAEREARNNQEFVEQLTLHVVPADDGVAWFGDHFGTPILFSLASYPARDPALRAATATIGLLPIASVAGYAVAADGP
jgi:hypothetical protein